MKPALPALLLTVAAQALAQAGGTPQDAGASAVPQLSAKFTCTAKRDDGEPLIHADTGEVKLKGDRIEAFRWESAVHRSAHGFDCSIDEGDGLAAEFIGDVERPAWRISLQDAAKARDARGYDFTLRLNCTIRVVRDGNMLHLKPTCPALCGSRGNFTELSVDLSTGACKYEE